MKPPIIKLSIDLHEIGMYFPLDFNSQGGFEYHMEIDRLRFDEVAALLDEFEIREMQVIQEFCFIILWIEKEIKTADNGEGSSGRYRQMLIELEKLKDYLLNNRITAISFKGEYEKNKPGEELTISHELNIDRICDGLRSTFRKEFQDKEKGKGKQGEAAWKRKRMGLVRNHILKYLDTIPKLESHSIESHYYIIGKLAAGAGFYKSEEEYGLSKDGLQADLYRNYLIQHVRMLR